MRCSDYLWGAFDKSNVNASTWCFKLCGFACVNGDARTPCTSAKCFSICSLIWSKLISTLPCGLQLLGNWSVWDDACRGCHCYNQPVYNQPHSSCLSLQGNLCSIVHTVRPALGFVKCMCNVSSRSFLSATLSCIIVKIAIITRATANVWFDLIWFLYSTSI